jgi:hypothetical protein
LYPCRVIALLITKAQIIASHSRKDIFRDEFKESGIRFPKHIMKIVDVNKNKPTKINLAITKMIEPKIPSITLIIMNRKNK